MRPSPLARPSADRSTRGIVPSIVAQRRPAYPLCKGFVRQLKQQGSGSGGRDLACAFAWSQDLGHASLIAHLQSYRLLRPAGGASG